MSAPTPGPWQGKCSVCNGGEGDFKTTIGCPYHRAAPELVEALRAMLDDHHDEDSCAYESHMAASALLARLDAK